MAVAHLSFPALRRGSPVPLGQLVEESRTPRTSSAPHHHLLLASETYSRLKSNRQIQADPDAIHFNGFSLGKGHRKVLKLINISSEVINVHIIPTQTKYFRTTYTKKHRLIPGLAYTVTVHFCPDGWRYYYDCLRVHCKGTETLLIPVHAYPVIDDLCIPPHIHLPSTPLGHSVSHSLPLRCSCPSDLGVEFQVHVVQAHPAFQVQPLAGSIAACGEAAVTVTFRPLEYGTCQVTLRLVISQFNSKPFLCTLTGSSAPHLPTGIPGGERVGVATLAADYRTRAVAPVVRDHAVLQPHPVCRIKRTASKKADTCKPPSPDADACTPAGVAKMLIKDGERLRSRDLREAMSGHSSSGGLRSRRLKEALFMQKVRADVTEEKTNRLRWQQRLGETPLSEQSRGKILEEREVAVHQYRTQQDPGHQEEGVFAWGPARPSSTQRVLRDARQAAAAGGGAPCFTFYCRPQLLLSLRALRLFQQAARKVVIRCRMDRRLACLRKTKRPSLSNQEHVKGLKKEEGLIPPDPIFPFPFPVCVNTADHPSLCDLTAVSAAPVDITMATHVPLFQLKVPQRFKVMGYSPAPSWEAFCSYVPPSLTRPLRLGALDELSPEGLRAQQEPGLEGTEGPGEAEDPGEDLRAEGALLQPGPAHPLQIFNPAPGLQLYKPPPPYLETSAELHLCPLPRFTDNRSKKNYLDQKEVIKGVMRWKSSDWTTLRLLPQRPTLCTVGQRTAGREDGDNLRGSLALRTDLLPERAPPALPGPPEDPDPTLGGGRLTEEPAVCLTPEMIRAEFLGGEAVTRPGPEMLTKHSLA